MGSQLELLLRDDRNCQGNPISLAIFSSLGLCFRANCHPAQLSRLHKQVGGKPTQDGFMSKCGFPFKNTRYTQTFLNPLSVRKPTLMSSKTEQKREKHRFHKNSRFDPPAGAPSPDFPWPFWNAMAPFATPAFLALATATGIFRVAGSVPALLRVRTSRALGANTFSTIQVLVAKMRKWEKSTIFF